MRYWNMAVLFFLGIASLLSNQGKAKAQVLLQLERSEVTLWPPLVGNTAFGIRQDPWFSADRTAHHDLPAVSPRLLLAAVRQTPVVSRPCLCAAPLSIGDELLSSKVARSIAPHSSRTGVEASEGRGS